MKYTKQRLAAHTTLVAFLSLGLLMCSSEKDEDGGIEGGGDVRATGGSGNSGNSSTGGSGDSSAGGSGDSSSTGGSGTSTGGSGTIPTAACNGLTNTPATTGEGGADSVCVGTGQEAEPFPVDILLVMDRSTSMGYEVSPGVTRLNLLSNAIQSYAADPDAADIGTGIVFFRALGATSASESGGWCDPAEYATPDVPIGPLADNADEITTAIDAIEPGGLTPSVPALEGAVDYARAHARANPDRATVVALVSDAFPTECNTDPSAQSDIAEAAYEGDPSIPVYAIGVGASAQFNLDNVARAGGTREALMTEDGTAAEDFVAALRNITLSDLKCEFRLPDPPDGMELQTGNNDVNVQMVYTPFSGEVEEMPYVGSLGGCGSSTNGGWYFDNTNNPTSIRVCPCTCSRFGAGTLEIRIGCAPQKIIT